MPGTELAFAATLRESGKSVRTLMAEVHFHLQGLELVGKTGAGLCAHLLVGPLLEAIEFLVDIHGCGDRGKGAGVAKVVRVRENAGEAAVISWAWAVCREGLWIIDTSGACRRAIRCADWASGVCL